MGACRGCTTSRGSGCRPRATGPISQKILSSHIEVLAPATIFLHLATRACMPKHWLLPPFGPGSPSVELRAVAVTACSPAHWQPCSECRQYPCSLAALLTILVNSRAHWQLGPQCRQGPRAPAAVLYCSNSHHHSQWPGVIRGARNHSVNEEARNSCHLIKPCGWGAAGLDSKPEAASGSRPVPPHLSPVNLVAAGSQIITIRCRSAPGGARFSLKDGCRYTLRNRLALSYPPIHKWNRACSVPSAASVRK